MIYEPNEKYHGDEQCIRSKGLKICTFIRLNFFYIKFLKLLIIKAFTIDFNIVFLNPYRIPLEFLYIYIHVDFLDFDVVKFRRINFFQS